MYALLNQDKTSILYSQIHMPQVWNQKKGRVCKTDTELIEYSNWRPLERISKFDTVKQYQTGTTIEFTTDKVIEYAVTTDFTLSEIKARKLRMIDKEWLAAVQRGAFISQSIAGFKVDCRRNDKDNDIQNIQGLMTLITAGVTQEPVAWKGADEVRELTLEQLQALFVEMTGYGAETYQRKFVAQKALANAETVDEVLAVNF